LALAVVAVVGVVGSWVDEGGLSLWFRSTWDMEFGRRLGRSEQTWTGAWIYKYYRHSSEEIGIGIVIDIQLFRLDSTLAMPCHAVE
jgi:hypothetical protein